MAPLFVKSTSLLESGMPLERMTLEPTPESAPESSSITNKKFIFERTADGSPTVRIVSGEAAPSEAMHSLKGAFSETLYIYGSAIETALSRGFSPTVLSMGLGLGYVELLATALFVKHGVATAARGESFELLPELREWFSAWLLAPGSSAIPGDFQNTYDEILARVAEHTGCQAVEIRETLASMVREKRWVISPALTSETKLSQQFACICFDAFSSKTSPDLWNEDFLKSFLETAAENNCVLSTYACTGSLKRALRAKHFDLDIRLGFASKRDSTFAVRSSTSK